MTVTPPILLLLMSVLSIFPFTGFLPQTHRHTNTHIIILGYISPLVLIFEMEPSSKMRSLFTIAKIYE